MKKWFDTLDAGAQVYLMMTGLVLSLTLLVPPFIFFAGKWARYWEFIPPAQEAKP